MNNILEFLINNKEWLFSGLGIVIFFGILSILRKLIFSKKQKTLSPADPQESKIVIGVPPSPAIVEAPLAPVTQNRDIIPPESLSPNEILTTIEQAPFLQQPEIAKHYVGLKVTWQGKLFSAWKERNDIVNIFIIVPEYRTIVFNVNPNDYPGLGLLKKGTLLEVEGIIEKINGYIGLSNAKIISITQPNLNSPS
jgi:hypothetical protein